jgi:hypothetical protein
LKTAAIVAIIIKSNMPNNTNTPDVYKKDTRFKKILSDVLAGKEKSIDGQEKIINTLKYDIRYQKAKEAVITEWETENGPRWETPTKERPEFTNFIKGLSPGPDGTRKTIESRAIDLYKRDYQADYNRVVEERAEELFHYKHPQDSTENIDKDIYTTEESKKADTKDGSEKTQVSTENKIEVTQQSKEDVSPTEKEPVYTDGFPEPEQEKGVSKPYPTEKPVTPSPGVKNKPGLLGIMGQDNKNAVHIQSDQLKSPNEPPGDVPTDMQNIVLTLKPTLLPGKFPSKGNKKSEQFKKDVLSAGYLKLNPETIEKIEILKTQGLMPTEFRESELNSALLAFSKGMKSDGLYGEIGNSKLNDAQKQPLYNIAHHLAAFEIAFPQEHAGFRKEHGNPEIEISRQPSSVPFQPNQIGFQIKQNILNPILDKVSGKISEPLKAKAENILVKGLEKGGLKLAKTKFATKAVGAAVLKTAAAIGAKTGISALLGAATGGVSLAIQAALMLGSKLLLPIKKLVSSVLSFITGEKDLRKQIAVLGGATAIAFLAAGQIVPATVAGAVSLGSAASIAGGGSVVTGIAGAISAAIFGLLGIVTASLLVPLLIAFVIIPLFFVITVYIINTGAYVVPYGGFTSTFPSPRENPYIGVEKTADPARIENPPPTRIVTYTITVTARQGSLTNISFEYDCRVMGTSGDDCPDISPPIPEPPSIITPTESFTFSYQATYDASHSDSIVVDTFAVSADVEGTTRQTGTTSANLIIGNPPTGCMVVSDAAQTWPAEYRTVLEEAIIRLASEQPVFTSRVCLDGEIPLCYDPDSVTYWGWHVHRRDCDILFSGGGFRRANDAIYILTHEVSHHLQRVMPELQRQYENSGALRELPICSYVATSTPGEGFAENNALYVEYPSYWRSMCGNTTYPERYPIHYNFADTVVFR